MISFDWISKKDIKTFTKGECSLLAQKLSNKLNLKIYKIRDEFYENYHFVVKYENYYVDILGIWKENEIINYWNKMLYRKLTIVEFEDNIEEYNQRFFGYDKNILENRSDEIIKLLLTYKF